jgi:hypothetical protein
MSTFSQFFNQYTNQIKNREAAKLQREQVMAARGANYAQAAQSTFNQILGKKGGEDNKATFELIGNDFKVNLDAIHDINNAKDFVEFINFDNNVRKYYDEEGNVVSGTLLAPTKVKNKSGEDTYIFNIEKKDGSIAPVTINRTSDPNDRILEFSKEDLTNFYNTQAANLAVKGGISGYAAGGLQGQIFGRKAEAQLAGAEMLSDSNLSPDSLINGIGQLNETLKSLTSEEEKAEIDAKPDGLDAETIGAEAAPELVGPQIETTEETESLIDLAIAEQNKLKEAQAFTTRGSEFNQATEAFVELDPASDMFKSVAEAWDNASNAQRAEWISAGLIIIPGLGLGAAAAGKAATFATKKFVELGAKTKVGKGLTTAIKKLFTKPGKELDPSTLLPRPGPQRLPETLAKGRAARPPRIDPIREVPPTPRDFSAPRTLFTTGVVTQLTPKVNIEEGAQQQVPELEPVPTIPTDLKGATEWFNNPDNQAALKRLPPEQVDSVRKLLQENNINSKEALVEAKRRNELSDIEYAKAAAVIAFSYNRGEDVGASQTIFNSLMNLGQTGSPEVTPYQAASLEVRRKELLETARNNRETQNTKFADNIADLYVVLGEEGASSDKFKNQLKAKLIPFLNKAEIGDISKTETELVDNLLAETIRNQANSLTNIENLGDFIADFFRGTAGDTVGNAMDNIKIIKDKDGKPIRVVTLITRGGRQVEGKGSLSWNDFTALLGDQRLQRYALQRIKDS